MSYHFKDVDDLTEKEREEFEKKFGGFNDFPPNWTEITEEEFAQSKFFTYSPDYVDYRQMLDGKNPCVSARLYFFWGDEGFAIVNDYWGKKVKYFRFYLCEHDYTELSSKEARKRGISHFGNCYHVLVCEKCDHVWSYDSSG